MRATNVHTQALSIEQVRNLAPSVFAQHASEGRSERYAFIPTERIMHAMLENNWEVVRAGEKRAKTAERFGFTKHFLRLRPSTHSDVALALNDVVPEILISNSHDGSSSYQIHAGMFRLVCLNGLLVSDSTVQSRRVRHTGDVVNDVIEGVYEVVQDMPRAVDMIQRMRGLMLSNDERMLLAETALDLRFGKNVTDENGDESHVIQTNVIPEQLLTVRRQDDSGADMWKTFNVIQENIVKGKRFGRRYNYESGKVEAQTIREVKSMDTDTKLNKALWSMAEKFLELKQA